MRLPKSPPHFRLTGAPVGSGNRVKRRSAEVQPHGLLQPGRRCVETSGDVIKSAFTASATICRALSYQYCRITPNIIGMLFLSASEKLPWELKRDLHFVVGEIDLEGQMRLAPTEPTFVSKFRSVLLGDVLATSRSR